MGDMDAYSIAMACASLALAIGFIIGHWLGKQDSKLAYQRGRLDGIHFVGTAILNGVLTKHSERAAGEAPSSPAIH